MQIHHTSDWHCVPPFNPADHWPVKGGVQVFAGDIVSEPNHWGLLASRLPAMPTIVVLGNHEFYGGHWPDDMAGYRLVLSAFPYVYLLEQGTVVVEGVRFIGTTLWTDLDNGAGAGVAAQVINDFRMIHHAGRLLTPVDIMEAHHSAVAWLRTTLAHPFDGPTVVVTHHAPSRLSHHKGFPLNERATAFQARLDNLIREFQPAAWIHGHTHWPVQYRIGRTWVVSNPLGYRGEGVVWDPDAMVEV